MSDRILSVTSPGSIAFRDLPPVAPGSAEVAGTTLFSLVSPGTELAVAFDGSQYGFPLDLGYAAVFRVESAGPTASAWNRDDLALCMGPHASRQLRPESELVLVPPGMDPALAPFARLMHVPSAVLATSGVRAGAIVGVAGLGTIGQLAVRVAIASGFEVIAADAAPDRRALLPAGVSSGARLPEQSVDLVIECSGHEASVLASAAALRTGGELALAGVPWKPREAASMHELTSMVFHRYLTMRSGWEWQVPWSAPEGEPSIPALLRRALNWLHEGAVDVSGLAERIPADRLPSAHRALRERRATKLTYLVDWSA